MMAAVDSSPHVSRTVAVEGVARRYEIVQHEVDLFAVTLFQDGRLAGPTDYMTSRDDARQLGEQWLRPRDTRRDD